MKKLTFLFVLSVLVLMSGCALFNGKSKDKPVGPDEVNFASLEWTFGGFNGKNAKLTEARIGGLNASGKNMSYAWASDSNAAVSQLNSAGKTSADLLACIFVKNSAGKWVGGKFEWISVSRTTRSFGNALGGYGGWSFAGVPNPTECAFIIVNPNTKARTNVAKAVWKR